MSGRLREIAKRLGISRNTVRRYLRSETTEPAYAERQSASAIDPYAFQLSGWLKTEAAKSRKQRRSLKQLHEDLSELGFGGSYDRVEEVLHYPLVLGDPVACEGHARQVDRALRRVEQEPLIAERVTTIDLMMALVSAGFALGLAGASQIAASREPGVVARPLAGRTPLLTTYLLRLDNEPSDALARFIERVNSIESLASKKPAFPTQGFLFSVSLELIDHGVVSVVASQIAPSSAPAKDVRF